MYQLLKCLTETSGTLTRLFNIKKRGRPEKRVSQNFLGDFSLLFAVALQILSKSLVALQIHLADSAMELVEKVWNSHRVLNVMKRLSKIYTIRFLTSFLK